MPDPRDTLHWPPGWKTEAPPSQMGPAEIKKLAEWMQAMYDWGRHVRRDILRLEGATNIGPGDPGDPPPPPWKPGG